MKIKIMTMKKLVSTFLFLLTTILFSQQNKIEAQLSSVDNDGLHSIKNSA